MKDKTEKLKFVLRNIPNLNIAPWLTGSRVNVIKCLEVKVDVTGLLHTIYRNNFICVENEAHTNTIDLKL